MSTNIRLLFVDDEEDFVEYMTKRLVRNDLDVVSFTHPVKALEETEGKSFDVGLLDLKMPDLDGEQLLKQLKARDPLMEVIILTGHGSIDSAFRASREGAYEYLQKPCDFDDLVASIGKAYAKRIKAQRKDQSEQVDGLLTRALDTSPLDVLRQLKRLSDSLGTSMAAAALAEEGDTDSAKSVLRGDGDE